jgi:hypothetical protein
VVDSGAGDEERHVAVLGAVAAVLGDVAGLAGVDDPVLDEADQVRYARVVDGGADEASGG